eukprot:UN34517
MIYSDLIWFVNFPPTTEFPYESEIAKNNDENGKGMHIIMVCHYKEPQLVFDRTMKSIKEAADNATWPVLMVLAAEEKSNFVQKKWKLKEEFKDLIISIHPQSDNINIERSGPMSNLLYALKTVIQNRKISELKNAIIHKLDGNVVVPINHCHMLEYQWMDHDPNKIFQPYITECGYEEWEYIPIWMKLIAISADACHQINWFMRYSAVHSCFCASLELAVKCNGWDPWFIMEEVLFFRRSYLAMGGNIKHRVLRSLIYNAPAVKFEDYFWQR